jgi:DNA-binding beta-propeller fold protein YncE
MEERSIEEGHRRLEELEKREKRKRRLRYALIILLFLLCLLLFALYYFYLRKELPIPKVGKARRETIALPRHRFNFDGGEKNHLFRPTDVAINPINGNVYVADTGKHRVAVFDTTGRFLFSFNKIGKGKDDTLQYPIYLDFDRSGNVWVVDRLLEAIYIFTPEGKLKKKFVPADKKLIHAGKNLNMQPTGIFYDRKEDKLYITEIELDHQVMVFNPKNGKLLLKFGKARQVYKKGEFPGYFSFPNDLYPTKDKIYVTDSDNRRIQIFDKKGKFQFAIETGGIPRGLDFGYKGRLHVVDAVGHQVLVFDPKGKFLLSFGAKGAEPDHFYYPNGIDCNGRDIYIADTWNHRISVWSWPLEVAPPRLLPKLPFPLWVLLPLLLIPLLWYYLRRKYVAHEDFLTRLIGEQKLRKLAKKVKRILVIESVYKKLEGYVEGDYEIRWLLRIGKYRESDVEKLKDAYPLTDDEAILLAMCYRLKGKVVLFIEDEKLRRIADKLGVVSMNYEEAAKHFNLKD